MGAAILDIGSRRELFVDSFLVESLNGARLKLQEPKPGGVAIEYDQPCEREPVGSRSFYTSVIKDGDIYRMYYRGDMAYSCYAESADGINWTKPSLGLVEVEGSTENNAIVRGRPLYPFIDGRAGVPESERYKANSLGQGGLLGYVSADGIHWRKMRDEVIVPRELVNHFDANSVMFWSEVEELYLLYARHMEDGRRATARATSEDFANWTGPTLMEYSDTGSATPSAQLYTNQTQPYFRAPHIYISLPGRIFFADLVHISREDDIAFARSRVITDEVRRFYDAEVDGRAGDAGDVADGVLLTSRAGTTRYDFTFRESFVRPGIGLSNWTTRNNYPACGVVQTGPTEMSLYVQRNYAQKDGVPRADDSAPGRLLVAQRTLRRRGDDHASVHLLRPVNWRSTTPQARPAASGSRSRTLRADLCPAMGWMSAASWSATRSNARLRGRAAAR